MPQDLSLSKGQNPPILLGVDVGGTTTDAVAVRGREVVAAAKVPTEPDVLARSVLAALDGVLADIAPGEVARVSLSTTLITNLLAQGKMPDVALLLLPGPGLDPALYRLPGRAWIAPGALDFRGREVAPVDCRTLDAALHEIHAAGYRHLAVVGKFSPRNPAHEQLAAAHARRLDPDWRVLEGRAVSGRLNFPRRAAATALTLAVDAPYRAFLAAMQTALAQRGLVCPVVILKADGGTLPLEAAAAAPLESIFSGPAASALGALALQPPGATYVVLDVGGTTTDLALVLDGQPLYATRGARLDGMPLPTRALAVRSAALGGDSTLAREDGALALRPTREGVAACLGGPAPTLTDALRVLGRVEVGAADRARAALAALGEPVAVAEAALEQALARLETVIAEMFAAWRQEPVYRLWELRQKGERRPELLVGLGAASDPLIPLLAERLGARALIPPYAPVANALGAAVARATYTTTLHIDTERRRVDILEAGVSEPLPPGRFTLEDARALARQWMARRGDALGIASPLDEAEETLAEQFNVVDGWTTAGRIFDVQWERRCGLVRDWIADRKETPL